MSPWFRSALPFIGFVALTLIVAGVSGIATSSSVGSWYPTLRKPAWNPPAWVFGPVWSVLYVMIGISGALVWRAAPTSGRTLALAAWFFQLALNAAWSPLFFGLRSPGLAMIEIVFLWAGIAAFVALSLKVSAAAGLLFIPYWAWVSFAAFLNFAIWSMNRGSG